MSSIVAFFQLNWPYVIGVAGGVSGLLAGIVQLYQIQKARSELRRQRREETAQRSGIVIATAAEVERYAPRASAARTSAAAMVAAFAFVGIVSVQFIQERMSSDRANGGGVEPVAWSFLNDLDKGDFQLAAGSRLSPNELRDIRRSLNVDTLNRQMIGIGHSKGTGEKGVRDTGVLFRTKDNSGRIWDELVTVRENVDTLGVVAYELRELRELPVAAQRP